jgi:hypothetical protein
MTKKSWEPKWKCPKATVPTHLQNHVVVWSWTLECSVKPSVTGPSTKCYFNEFLFMRVLTHDSIEWINGCEHSECHGLPLLCWVYLQEMVLKNNPSDHETWPIWCHVGIHVDFTSISHSRTPLVPQAPCDVNWTSSVFSTNESGWSVLVTGSQSQVWSGPYIQFPGRFWETIGWDPSVSKSNQLYGHIFGVLLYQMDEFFVNFSQWINNFAWSLELQSIHMLTRSQFSPFISLLWGHEWGELAASSRWTGWVWEITIEVQSLRIIALII